MSQTYEQHKAAVDTAYPTPTAVWQLHGEDLPHNYDNYAIADTLVAIMGDQVEFEVHYNRVGDVWSFSVLRVEKEEAARKVQVAVGPTWAACKSAFATRLEAYMETGRITMATEAYARDLLMDDGITAPLVPTATAATATLAGIEILGHWTLAPVFAPDTFVYAFPVDHDTFIPIATLGFAGQTIFWKHGHNAYVGMAPTIWLNSGENVIEATVVSQDGLHVKTYTLTVTR